MSRMKQAVIPTAVSLLLGASVVLANPPEQEAGNIGEGHVLYQRSVNSVMERMGMEMVRWERHSFRHRRICA